MTSPGAPIACTRPVAHRDELVGVARGEVEVVQHHDDRGAALAVEVGEQVEHLDLVGDVEEGRRLVEQQDVGLLRERHRDPHALALAARELVDRPIGEVGDAGRVERGGDGLVVVRAPAAEQPLVRMPPAPDEVGDDDALGRDRALRQQPEDARDLLGRAAVQRARRRARPARLRGASRRASARSSVDLPHPFAPTIAVILPGHEREVEPVDDGAVAVARG